MSYEIITKKVDQLAFGVVSPNHIKKISTVNILSPELYDADGFPVDKGLMDLSMGVIDPGLRCKTCGGRLRDCPGHFGYIQIAKPVLHILYIGHMYNLLKGFCGSCGRIQLAADKLKQGKLNIQRAKLESNVDAVKVFQKTLFATLKKSKVCGYCGAKTPTIKLEKPMTFTEGDRRLWPTEIRERLEKIPDEDLEIVGFDPISARPEWYVVTSLLVPPIAMRPSITLITGERSEDDLTHKLSDIVRVNQRLMENINAGAPEIIVEDLWDLLQYHVTTYFSNSVAGVPVARHKTSRPLKTLAQRLKGKDGRFRYNLAGKRVNFCARSVISPDPLISIDEIGVPTLMRTELTVPERVTEWNMAWLKNFIKNAEVYPGANYVVTADNKRKKITEDTKEQILEELAPSWVVERHILNNDIVLFNRQPSLHRLSMMAHKVRLLPGKTFRIHPAVCKPYNADFDGDEMNLHMPQNEEARAEARNLLILDRQVITPRYGKSIMGEVDDSLVGLYLLVKGNLWLTKQEVSELLCEAGMYDFDFPEPEKKTRGEELYSGRQIFSMLLPKNFNFKGKDAEITNGELVEFGTRDKLIDELLGPEQGRLIHKMYLRTTPKITRDFINHLNRLGLAIAFKYPYTFSFSDLDIPAKTKETIKEHLAMGESESRKILKQYKDKKIIPLPGKSVQQTREAMLLGILNAMRMPVGREVERTINPDSNMILLAKCGIAKLMNLALMSGFAGQQALRGERIHIGYTNRTLPHFKKGDLSPRARGFVYHGYAEGMDPIETFFNAIVGRDSLVDTAMRTPKSGYMQRKLINALQDLKVSYDGTVRDASQRIVQFVYGGDNVDVSKSDNGEVDLND